MHPTGTSEKTGERQGRIWSTRADDWAGVQEVQMQAAYEHALDELGVGQDARLLDLGCGAGLALRLAVDRGATVTGLDAAEGMLVQARRQVPEATVVQGDLEELPFPADSFDFVTGFNSFQFAASPAGALAEAVRVARGGGQILALVWGPADTCDATVYLAAVGALMPPPPPGAPGPFALSGEAALTDLFSGAGLDSITIKDVPTVWRYPDEQIALRGLMSSGPAVIAIEHSGEPAVQDATRTSIKPFRQPDGSYVIANLFRYVVGLKPASNR